MDEISSNLNKIKQLIIALAKKYNRSPSSVGLLAVSKSQPLSKMQSAILAKQTAFGENYLQEALTKMEILSHHPELEWHFIGKIQRNKTRKIAEHFDWVHSIDSEDSAKRLNDQRPQNLPPLNVCIEVNISHERSKGGTNEQEIFKLARFCESLPKLKLRGLMSIPALVHNLNEQRKAFKSLAIIFEALKREGLAIDTLSMGTSNDFEAAIAEGSTLLRLGTAIFGPRIES